MHRFVWNAIPYFIYNISVFIIFQKKGIFWLSKQWGIKKRTLLFMQPKHASRNACNAGWNPHTKLRSTETQHVDVTGRVADLPLADTQILHNYYKNYYQRLQLPWIFKVFVRQKCQSELKTREKEQKEKVNQTKALDCLHIYNWKKKGIELIEGMKPRNPVSSWVP